MGWIWHWSKKEVTISELGFFVISKISGHHGHDFLYDISYIYNDHNPKNYELPIRAFVSIYFICKYILYNTCVIK